MCVRNIIPVMLMSSVLVACGGGTGASLSIPATTTTSGSNNGTTTNTGTGTSTGGNTGTSTGTTGGSSTSTGGGTATGGTTGGTTSGEDNTGNTSDTGNTFRLLTRNAVDAAYSDALERLITVSSSPDNALNIINPASGEQQAVVLNLTPTSLAISPDGKTAVVGHKNAVTHVNLQTASVLDFYNNLNLDIFDIALDARGIAYATPQSNDLWGTLKSINLSTGAVESSLSVVQMGGSYLQLASSLNALYLFDKGTLPVDLIKADVSTAPPVGLYDSPYNGDYDIGGAAGKGLWLTEDDAYILTAGETLFRTATTQDQDMLYQRSVSDNDNDPTTTLLHADHSQEAEKFVVILDKGITGTGSDYRLKTYSTPQLVLSEEKKLSEMDLDNSGDPVIPQFAFFNSDGTKRYAVVKQGTGTYLQAF